MNKYLLRIANTEIELRAFNEYAAIMATGLFSDAIFVGAYKKIDEEEPENKFAWVYKVEVNGKMQICVIERLV